MAKRRSKPEGIVTTLRRIDFLTGQGMPRLDVTRQIGVTEQTFYHFRKKHGGAGTDQIKELKRLLKERTRAQGSLRSDA
ncbi:hypothetical protein KX928_03205 [Roseobacter sp. YSTF-M11]|uniref:Transposase n=1 Tax=Roseobacter insulae TaxID=2859783 RepID=A0A9X1FSV8_9RHOB|nr:hypothetical protein [Roseobacter insulae]